MAKLKRVKQQIKSFLLVHGIAEPEGLRYWSAKAVEALGRMALREPLGFTLKTLLKELAFLDEQVAQIEQQMQGLAETGRHGAAVAVMDSHPGVGLITALSFRTELFDPGRFRDGKEVGQYVGLAPRVRQSGQTRRDGPISRTGRGPLRALLIQAAWRWIDKDKQAQAVFDRLVHNTGKSQKAIVGMARRLAIRLWRMQVTGELYRQAA